MILSLLVKAVACWRVSTMLVGERGPLDVFLQIREATGIKHDENGTPIEWNDKNPLSCLLCTSVWVGAALYFAPAWVSEVLALSGTAVLLDKKLNELPFPLQLQKMMQSVPPRPPVQEQPIDELVRIPHG